MNVRLPKAGIGDEQLLDAFLDTNVLFPRVLRDTLLDAALAGLYVPRWSGEVLEELRRNLVRHRGLSDSQGQQLVVEMDRVFSEARVDGYQHLVPDMTNHPKDRHVLAAAVHTRAHVVVTNNLADFPTSALAPHGIFALSPDDFLLQLFDEAPDRMVQVIIDQAANYQRPTMTVADLIDRLAKHVPSVPPRFLAEHL